MPFLDSHWTVLESQGSVMCHITFVTAHGNFYHTFDQVIFIEYQSVFQGILRTIWVVSFSNKNGLSIESNAKFILDFIAKHVCGLVKKLTFSRPMVKLSNENSGYYFHVISDPLREQHLVYYFVYEINLSHPISVNFRRKPRVFAALWNLRNNFETVWFREQTRQNFIKDYCFFEAKFLRFTKCLPLVVGTKTEHSSTPFLSSNEVVN